MHDASQLRIEAAHKKIAEVFSKEYAFTVPAYQRPYAWETTQAEELLADLKDAMTRDSAAGGFYFLGSIVLVKTHGAPASRVVDGQQRLTTLTLLFSVIRDLTEGAEKKAQRESYIKQVANEDEGIPEALRLQLRQKDQGFFETHIQTRGATNQLPSLDGLTDSKARIVENAKLIRYRLEAMDEKERDELLRFLLQNCYLVLVEVPSDTAARRIFTVLNARGLDLSATDILKADLLERAGTDKESSLSHRWEEVEAALGRDRFSALFTHIRMIYERDKPRSALESGFSVHVPAFRENPVGFIDAVLEPYADALMLAMDDQKLRTRFGAKSADLVRSLERLDNRDWLPPLLLCLRKSNGGDDIDVPEFVFRLERLAYFLFLTRADVNARMSRYVDVLDDLDVPTAPKFRSTNRDRSKGLEIEHTEATMLFKALDGNVYLVPKIVKPLLLRLEQASTDGSANYNYPVISVEHICPQTISSGSQWEQWFSDTDDHAAWVHSLANLVLLNTRKNSAAQNYDFDLKKTKYFASGDSCAFTLTNEVRGYSQWTLEELEVRRIELLERLAKTWRLEPNLERWWDED
ncbi:DUF262 domain-containing HNH endonuclease family protein [Pseudomonas phytophila]|uniref:DUF262 domain-containing HNH endonuclease family protein n=1 Tax=Pseudomonas phytophila TaxID=2867264 RepID=A0ABY6FB77_9PSED|nr:DUF262 domain-containing HNH endonuclease family protein [Pseudomonas phytophila]UXZ95116.1 DUF262 domain-containing HNH endonuclease family protein [Pseudomonas phytophila]